MRQRDPSRIGKLLALRHWSALRAELEGVAAMDVADLLMLQPAQERIFLLKLLAPERAADVLTYVESPLREGLLKELTPHETLALLRDMPSDERANLLAAMPPGEAEVLLEGLPAAEQADTRLLLACPDGSVGRLMDTRCIRLRPQWRVVQALEQAREQAGSTEMANLLFVTTEAGELLGGLRLRSLILAPPEMTVDALLQGQAISLPATASPREAVQLARHYDLEALPVVDDRGQLLGIVTIDDLMDVAETETTADLQRMGGVAALRIRLRHASVALLYRKRIGWLLALVALSIGGSSLLYQMAPTLQAAVFLIAFLPLIIDCGGNAGAQTAILTVRALAQGEIHHADWKALVLRELKVATALGSTVALAAGALGLWRVSPEVGAVVALTVAPVIVIGSLIGIVLPLLLDRLGLDPATASTPLVTSIADICGILIYFSIATAILTVPAG